MPIGTTAVRLVTTAACFVEIGKVAVTNVAPTAIANTSMYLAAGIPEYFACYVGAFVSAIQVAAAGSLYITPLD
jgi:hypothetical protein